VKRTHNLTNRPAFFTTPGNSRMKVGIICSTCGEIEAGSDRPGLPPAVIARHFAAKGWKVYREGVSATCPKCQAAPPAPIETDDAEASLERQRAAEARRQAAIVTPGERLVAALPPKSEPTMTTTTSSTTNAIRAQATMHRLLGEHFTTDGAVGAYDEGWSDARVSNEAGLALVEVVRVREAAYGRVVDPRLAKLETALAAAQVKLTRDLGEITTMLETIREEGTKALAALTRQLAEARGLASR